MTSLSNRQTPPIRIEGILPSLHNLPIVISCNFKYFAVSLVVIICAKIDPPVGSSPFEKCGPGQERRKHFIPERSFPHQKRSKANSQAATQPYALFLDSNENSLYRQPYHFVHGIELSRFHKPADITLSLAWPITMISVVIGALGRNQAAA